MKKLLTLFLGLTFSSLFINTSPLLSRFSRLQRFTSSISEIDAEIIIDKLICDLFTPNENIQEIINLRKKIIESVLKHEVLIFNFYARNQISYNPTNISQKALNLVIKFIEEETDKSISNLFKTMDFGIYKNNETIKCYAASKTKIKIRNWVTNLISDYAFSTKGTLASFFGKSLEDKIREQIWFEIDNFYPQFFQ